LSTPSTAAKAELKAIEQRWNAAWPRALEVWSRFTRLSPPILCRTHEAAKREGLSGSFAMIRFADQAVVIDLAKVVESQLEDFATEILAHEIGHHVLAPSTLTDHGRMLARMRAALPTLERHAPMLANLYTDLLINDRLQRSAQLRMADVYRALSGAAGSGEVWALYMRIYEVLWNVPRGQLGGGALEDSAEGDAWLGARLVRSYARNWLEGSGRFASLFLSYVHRDQSSQEAIERLLDTRDAGRGGDATGLTDVEPAEQSGAIHPALDPELCDVEADGGEGKSAARATGQAREPFEYGELLRALGLPLDDHEVAVRYYRERALPHLVPFPSERAQESTEPLLEGLEPWDIGHPLDALDLLQSVIVSPRVIPGLTTVQRSWGTEEGQQPKPQPLDLDLYVDSSGSMPNPQHRISYPTLAGAILCLSALRAGASVQATLWSGKNQCGGTQGFVRDELALLRVLTGFYGGGTAFPLHRLRETYDRRAARARPAHVLVISDDGVSTMFDDDERGESGWLIAKRALAKARGGGTFVLELHDAAWDGARAQANPAYGAIRRARDEQGWNVQRVASLAELVAFARAFSRLRYAGA